MMDRLLELPQVARSIEAEKICSKFSKLMKQGDASAGLFSILRTKTTGTKVSALLNYARQQGNGPAYVERQTPNKMTGYYYKPLEVLDWLEETGYGYQLDQPETIESDEALTAYKSKLVEEIQALQAQLANLSRGTDESGLLNLGELLYRSRPYEKLCGIYFLIEGDEVVYVGQSINVTGRLEGHINTGKQFSRYAFIPVPADQLDYMESIYIRKYQPKLNVTQPKHYMRVSRKIQAGE